MNTIYVYNEYNRNNNVCVYFFIVILIIVIIIGCAYYNIATAACNRPDASVLCIVRLLQVFNWHHNDAYVDLFVVLRRIAIWI